MFISKTSFDSNGTEGMLDVILGCTLIFILMSSLISADRESSQEKTLPDINLTKASAVASGAGAVKKSVISLKMKNGKVALYLESDELSMKELEERLKNMGGVAHVALRRDQDMPCKWEDQIILMCRRSGIEKVAIIVGSVQSKKGAENE